MIFFYKTNKMNLNNANTLKIVIEPTGLLINGLKNPYGQKEEIKIDYTGCDTYDFDVIYSFTYEMFQYHNNVCIPDIGLFRRKNKQIISFMYYACPKKYIYNYQDLSIEDAEFLAKSIRDYIELIR